MDVPALNECWRTAPYLYDGRSYSMKDMLKVHGPHKPVTEKELEELEEYVLSLSKTMLKISTNFNWGVTKKSVVSTFSSFGKEEI